MVLLNVKMKLARYFLVMFWDKRFLWESEMIPLPWERGLDTHLESFPDELSRRKAGLFDF